MLATDWSTIQKHVYFIFNQQRFTGCQGDTLASALLANGKHLVGRSFKYHRPRGIFSAGPEEPNALVELRTGAYREPNTRATCVELFDTLEANSQNHFGPLNFDVMAINDRLSAFLGAGFYYKTFMWPKSFWEKIYEPAIRAAAGLGRLSMQEDPDTYDKGFLHTDLLVIGAGPTGLMAALTAGRAGHRVIVAEEDFLAGGRLNHEHAFVDSQRSSDWAKQCMAELASLSNVRLLTRTAVFGSYDHGIYGALQRKTDHLADSAGKPRQILWRIYSKQALLCAGSTERSIAFANNDRPGIMLAGAVRTYLHRYGVAAGRQVAIFTNNDDGWRTARDLLSAGVEVTAVVDTRAGPPPLELKNVPVFMNNQVVSTNGRLNIYSMTLASGEKIYCDCLAVSGGWSPNVHLSCHQRGRPVWQEDIAAFVPGSDLPVGMRVAGAANGQLTLAQCLSSGHAAAQEILRSAGNTSSVAPASQSSDQESAAISAFWHVSVSKHGSKTDSVTNSKTGYGKAGSTKARAWIDLQNDVTTKDLMLAHRDGFRSVEHAKRYTTLGMATDQGKTSNVLGLAIMAEIAGQSIPDTGTTIFRPPYTPVPIGAIGGRARGQHFRPTRLTPSHQWATEHGGDFVEVGPWLRAQWFTQAGETHWRESVDREVRQTRNSVGVCDVSSLGKIDVQGRDAAEFLDFVYANMISTLKSGRVRYGLMLREDGFVMDDGTVARLAEHHYLISTTTANAGLVMRHMEFCRQCLCPDKDVHLVSATDQWAQFAIAGPNARKVLKQIVDTPFDLANEAFPFMACAELTVCNGTPSRLFRISFSGEMAYELAVPARFANALMQRLMVVGNAFNIAPYGTEALGVMRIEKGHAAGNELNGQTTANNLGLGRMVSKKKDCIGNTLSQRSAMNEPDAYRLVGFRPVDNALSLRAGAHFVAQGVTPSLHSDEGWMSSVAWSPILNGSIGLGFIKNGHERLGETVNAVDPLHKQTIEVTIMSPHFVDPEGERLHG